jgi:putative membrane protein
MKAIHTAWLGVLAVAAASAWPQGAAPTDPQIAAIVVTANQVDIDAGKLAKSKSAAKDVKDFAQRMITDHSGINKSATELVQKLHVKPESNATSQSLQQGGDQNLAALRELKDGAFERPRVS